MEMRLKVLLYKIFRLYKRIVFRLTYSRGERAGKVIFVTGIMRSGTTLLQRVIAQSCKVQYTSECDALSVIINSFRSIEQYEAYQHLPREAFVKIYRNFINSFFDEHAIRSTLRKNVYKDPEALTKIRYYLELMPDVRFVISVRNPLATIASIWRVRNNQLQSGVKSPISVLDFEQTVDLVKRLSDEILAAGKSGNVCIVKYEDLVEGNENTICRLGKFIGEKISLELPDDRHHFDRNNPFWTPETGAKIDASSLEKFRHELTTEQCELATTKLGKFMQIFDYT